MEISQILVGIPTKQFLVEIFEVTSAEEILERIPGETLELFLTGTPQVFSGDQDTSATLWKDFSEAFSKNF